MGEDQNKKIPKEAGGKISEASVEIMREAVRSEIAIFFENMHKTRVFDPVGEGVKSKLENKGYKFEMGDKGIGTITDKSGKEVGTYQEARIGFGKGYEISTKDPALSATVGLNARSITQWEKTFGPPVPAVAQTTKPDEIAGKKRPEKIGPSYI